MSKLYNYTATGTLSSQAGYRVGGIVLAAGSAAAAAVITEVVGTLTFTRVQLAAPANGSSSFPMTDGAVGAYFDGTVILSTLSGAGASINIEQM